LNLSSDRPGRRGAAHSLALPGRAVAAAAPGAVWGLGLARVLAESLYWRAAFVSPPLVMAIGLACAAAAVAVGRWLHSGPNAPSSDWAVYVPLLLPLLYIVGIAATPLAGIVLLLGGALLSFLMVWRGRPTWLLPVLAGLISLGVYAGTLLPSVGEADTFEFQVVVPRLGVAHPTGYPLYVILAKAFTFFPVRNIAWRVNLSSAVFGAAAVVVVYGVARELNGVGRRDDVARRREVFALLTALAVAFSATFWSQAVAAEVYTLHNLLVAGLLLLLLRRACGSDAPQAGSLRPWYGAFLLMGLSLTNHLTTALLAPAFFLSLVFDRPEGEFGEWLAAGALFALGLGLYLFIPLRWPTLNDGARMSAQAFLRYITGGQFHGALQLDGWRDPARWRIMARLLAEPFGWPGIGLAVVGIVHLALRRQRALALTAITFIGFFAYGLAYHVADVAVFLLPAHLILGLWMGLGAFWMADGVSGLWSGDGAAGRSAVVVGFALIPLSGLWGNLPAVDRSGERGRVAWGRYALEQPLEEESAVLADTTKFAPLYYLQQVEGVRPDLDIVLLGTEAQYQADLRRRLAESQTVYLARYLPQLDGLYLRSVGPLAEVGSAPPSAESSGGSVLAEAAAGIDLLDVEVEKDPFDRPLRHVTLTWRASRPVARDLVVRLRVVDGSGEVHWREAGARPVNDLYPTNAWPPGVTVTDYHEVELPPWLDAGDYRLDVALSGRFTDEDSAEADGSLSWTALGSVEVEQRSDPGPLPSRRLIALRPAWLTGYDVPDATRAGGPMPVELSWRGIQQREEFTLSWGGATESEGASRAYGLASGTRRSRHEISAPDQAGEHVLRVRTAGNRLHCGWLGRVRESCPLARVEVAPAGEGVANFGDQVLLREADLGTRTAQPGEVVPVSLRWRGMRAMTVDYTVFVQLIGPDGKLHGQVDSWPVQGTYPTSEWAPGRDVLDPYDVRLKPDAPTGEYRVVVGLYELETMERLRVLSDDGKPTGDSYVVGTVDVGR